MRSEYNPRSEYVANKALFETFQIAKKVAQALKKPEAKLADMESMKEWQVKNKAFGRAMFLVD